MSDLTITVPGPSLPSAQSTHPLRILTVWCQRARTRRHLSKLDAHRLEDVGLTVAQARIEAAKPFWRA